MAEAAKTQEPSTEELLARMRRIIAEDDSKSAQHRTASANPEPPAPASAHGLKSGLPAADSLDEETISQRIPAMGKPTDAMGAQIPQPADTSSDSALKPGTAPQSFALDSNAEPRLGHMGEQVSTPSDGDHSALSGREREQLISGEVKNAVHAAFDALAQTVLVDNARTLEDLVGEMLRPMLTAWLNDNLPTVVERLVRAEIGRVSRGKR
jgi:uncharacterized protein